MSLNLFYAGMSRHDTLSNLLLSIDLFVLYLSEVLHASVFCLVDWSVPKIKLL